MESFVHVWNGRSKKYNSHMKDKQMKERIKDILGSFPFLASWYWHVRQQGGPPPGGFVLTEVEEILTDWVEVVKNALPAKGDGKDLFIFAMTRQWISQTTLTALGLKGLGHKVTLGFIPNLRWKEKGNAFDLHRQNVYVNHVLEPTKKVLNILPIVDLKRSNGIPDEFEEIVQESSLRDVKYTLMRDDVDTDHEMFPFRLHHNLNLAQRLFPWIDEHRPDAIIVPNGSVLEFGVVFHMACFLDIPVVTYEFGEQIERVWLAQNRDVMRQDTDQMWQAYRDKPLTEKQRAEIEKLYAARRGAAQWKNFSRQWQKASSQGGEQVRAELGLDERPIVLLPTNVLGDSLTLGREIFSESMTEWIVSTIHYFMQRPQFQLVVRIHPGEQLSWGPSVYEILGDYFDELPDHILIIGPTAEVNSYDLLEISSGVTVFTTTMGMEAAMRGLPVIVVGDTHYRDKGFTTDPQSWEEYFSALETLMQDPSQFVLEDDQVKRAWRYAYRFFFSYPFPFPWHVQHYREDIKRWPLERVFSKEGQEQFGKTFRYLSGEPIEWRRNH